MSTPIAPVQKTPRIQFIPTVSSAVFADEAVAPFAVGVMTFNDVSSGFGAEFAGAAQLRAKTYLDSGFVREDELDEQGTELDADDYRAVHLVVLERASPGSAKVIGNVRLVVKDAAHPEPLPVERYYPEHYGASPLPLGSVEVSRLIARHADSRVQNWVKWPLFIAGFKHLMAMGLGTSVHGLLEPRLARGLLAQRVPIKRVAEAKYIASINATKLPVEIDMPGLGRLIASSGDHGIDLSPTGFSYLSLNTVEGPVTAT